jgi:hypothetical protein
MSRIGFVRRSADRDGSWIAAHLSIDGIAGWGLLHGPCRSRLVFEAAMVISTELWKLPT